MEDLLAFLDELEQDEVLKKAFLEAEDFDDICKLAKSYGYYFTVDELEEYYLQQVSGGAFVHTENQAGTLTQHVDGDNNVVMNYGDVTVAKGYVDGSQKTPMTYEQKMAVLGMLFGGR